MTRHGKPTARSIGSLFCCTLVCALLLCASASAADYPDVEGHWARGAIGRWSDSGILKGYSNGDFGPDDPVTRAQLSEVLYRIWGCGPKGGHTFADVSPNAWYAESLLAMNAYGVALDRGGLIRPDEALTREEAFYMVAKAFGVGGDSDTAKDITKVTDAEEIEPSFTWRISTMLDLKYVKGAPDGALHPKDLITRAEIMQVIDNMFDLYIREPGAYTLQADQVALVACGGVTIDYTPIPDHKYTNMAKAYLMAGTVEGGVTFLATQFQSQPSLMLEVRGVSEGGLSWTEEGLHSATERSIDLSDPKQVPDMRFAGGMGTKRSPYLIETAEQFRLLDGFPYTPNVNIYFELQNDIVLPGNQACMDIFTMRACLEGNGHTVTYTMGEGSFGGRYAGLFGSWHGSCSNLTLAGTIDLTVDEASSYDVIRVGGLAAKVSGTLSNCTSEMDITVRYSGAERKTVTAGGLAGIVNRGGFSGCTGSGRVSVILAGGDSSADAGGLAGSSAPEAYTKGDGPFPDTPPKAPPAEGRVIRFTGCGSTADVSVRGGYHAIAGGLVGSLSYYQEDVTVTDGIFGVVENCWSTARVSASGASFQDDCGGIVGQLNTGTVRGCWAAPTAAAAGEGYPYLNVGGIAGGVYGKGIISDCWANASGIAVPGDGGHYGGITGRMAGSVSNCFALGTARFAAENGITYASWTEGPVTASLDMTGAAQGQLEAFYQSCGWDFETVWDKGGPFPILRGCDAAAQRAAQD